MTESPPLGGLWCASLTPLDQAGRIDHGRFVDHCRDLLRRGIDGIVPFGTTGEGPSFAVGERMAALDELLAAGIPPAQISVAVGCTALPDTVALTRHAVTAGCPRCLVMPPYFWKGIGDDGLFAYFATLIESVGNSDLRLYLYHIPQLSAVTVGPGLIARLAAAYPAVIAGVKDSGGDFRHTLSLLQGATGLRILTGHEPDIPRLMKAGGAGTICGSANLIPESIAALLRPAKNETNERRVQAFVQHVEAYPFVPALKAVLAVRHADSAWRAVRPPLRPLPETEAAVLLARLHGARLFDANRVAAGTAGDRGEGDADAVAWDSTPLSSRPDPSRGGAA